LTTLTVRNGVIYYQRRVRGNRIRFSCETDDWDSASAVARLYEEQKKIGALQFTTVEIPRLAEFAERYLEEDTSHLASTTRKDRYSYLSKTGPLVSFFGDRPINEIGVPELRSWWNQEVVAVKKRSVRTGRAYLDVLSSVLGYACDLGLLERNPIPGFRETLRRRSGTKGARAASSPSKKVCPIERSDELAAVIREAKAEGLIAQAFVLLCLDAGLRVGEVLGLRWKSIEWGDDRDLTRGLRIEEN
jgi:integrase